MNDQEYLEHCLELLDEYSMDLAKRTEHLPPEDPLRELCDAFCALADNHTDLYARGAELVARLFTTYPELAPALPRQLLWFFGGDCLHYMPDEEIAQFQQLEDMMLEAEAAGEPFNIRDARAKLLNLQ